MLASTHLTENAGLLEGLWTAALPDYRESTVLQKDRFIEMCLYKT